MVLLSYLLSLDIKAFILKLILFNGLINYLINLFSIPLKGSHEMEERNTNKVYPKDLGLKSKVD
jgi:hypothetical protein